MFSDHPAGDEETALIMDGEYYVLNGDFRKQYEKLSTKKEAKAFYDRNRKEHGSAWSTDNINE